MSVEAHRKDAPARLRVAWVTISDTRNEATDEGGHLGRRLIEGAGHELARYRVLRDEPPAVEAHLRSLCEERAVDAIVTSGGTGISNRDRTFETLTALIERPIVGFGELFRSLSFAEIGAAAMLSRATAGLVAGVPIFACPGSIDAVRLALEKLILPELGHVVREARR